MKETKFTFYGRILASHLIFSKGKIDRMVVSGDAEFVFVTLHGRQILHAKFEEIKDEYKIKCIVTTKNKRYEGIIRKKLNDRFFNYGMRHEDITKITYLDSDNFVITGSFNKDYLPHGECTVYKDSKIIKGVFFNGITSYLGKLINYRCEILNAEDSIIPSTSPTIGAVLLS